MQISLPREERRNKTKLYNPMTIKELNEKMPGIPWLDYMNNMLAPHHVLTENERVIVAVPDFFPKLIDLLAQTPKRLFFFLLISATSMHYRTFITISGLWPIIWCGEYLLLSSIIWTKPLEIWIWNIGPRWPDRANMNRVGKSALTASPVGT